MNTHGATWLTKSRRKVAAVVAGIAILGSAAGIASPDASESASTWSRTVRGESSQVLDTVSDRDVQAAPGVKTPPRQARSTWS